MSRGVEMLSEAAPVNMADDWYQFATSDHFWFQWRMASICRLMKGLDIGERPLEIGSGNGAARAQLASHFQRPIDGCDLNLAALELDQHPAGQLYCYDVHQRRPEWEECFSSIFLLDVLEHIEDPVAFLESVRFHLRPQGLLVINVPAMPSLYSRYDEVDGHVKRYRTPALRAELESAGLQLLRHAYWGFTMLPIIGLRKIVMHFTSRERVMARGFQPPSKLADAMLRTLMFVETRCFPRPWLGTSLVVVAQREN